MISTDERVVLVVAGQGDLFSDKIILALHEQGADVVRADLSATPLQMDCAFLDGAWSGTIHAGDGRTVELDKVISVLWRQRGHIPGHPEIADLDQRSWAAEEDSEAVLGVLRSLPSYWMNHPDRLAAIEGNKPGQLRDAHLAGLKIPPTLITTSGRSATTWMRSDAAHIYKAFRAPYRPHQGEPGWVLATRVDDAPPEELYAASIFQELIEGTSVRVTIIGDQIFAASISGIVYDVDWRPQQADADMELVPVPDAVLGAVRALMARWGLTYGAVDFILTPAGEWVFLEINPTGAYGFVEEATGMPLTKTIAETLIRGARACRH